MRGLPLAALFALLIAAAFPARAQSPAEPAMEKRVVIGIYGGLLGKELRDVIDAYTKPLGVEAVYIEGTSNDLLAKVRAQKANPQIDLFVGNDQTFAVAKSLGLLEKLDPKLVPNLARVEPAFRDPDGYGQAYVINPVGLIYRTDSFAKAGIPPPTSWLAYENPKLSGRTVLFPPTVSYGFQFLIGLAKASGKDEHDVAPAWTAMEHIAANHPFVVPSPGQAETMVSQGEAWIYVCSADRAALARAQGSPVAFALPKDGTVVFPNMISPVHGAKNPVAAQRVLNQMISAEVQTEMLKRGAVAPVNKDVEVTPDQKRNLGFDGDKPLPAFHLVDVTAVNRQLDEWVEHFDRLMSH